MKKEPVSLIDGNFDPDEAKELLSSLLNDKIHFHQMKNFSSTERFGKQDQKSLKRIAELKEGNNDLLELISKAESENKILSIFAKINIDLIDRA